MVTLFAGAELLELEDEQSIDLVITTWELGEMDITRRTDGIRKRIRTLRVQVPPEKKTLGPPYWDITSQRLIEQLLPTLNRPDSRSFLFRIQKHGVAPTAKFSVHLNPPA